MNNENKNGHVSLLATVATEVTTSEEKGNFTGSVDTPNTPDPNLENIPSDPQTEEYSNSASTETSEPGNAEVTEKDKAETDNGSADETSPEEKSNNEGGDNNKSETPHKHKKNPVIKIRFSSEELEKIEERAEAHGVSKYAYIRQRCLDADGSDLLTYEEQVDEVKKKVGFLENKLPIFEKLYQTTGKYVDKINLAFGDLLKNVSYFEERKDKILQQTKDFRIYIAMKEEDKKSLTKEMGDILEEYKCGVTDLTEKGEKSLETKRAEFQKMIDEGQAKIIKTIDEQMKKIQDANNNIIQKVEVNASFIDNINRIKREYLLAFFAFLISGTILMTIIVTYLLQMK